MGVPTERRAKSNAAFWLLFAIFALVVLLLYRTAGSIASIWQRSNTFGHGFLIPPIVAWLIWRKREEIRAVPIRPNLAWLAPIVVLGFAWLWGSLAGVLILEQFSFAFLIPATVGAVMGTAMLRALLFPLGFLLLGVPAGDAISGPLIEFTADFAVIALQISGVPVNREGPYLTIPNALWVVTDACSGFRYLMASLTLGCLYAYLQFRTWRYRLFFIALSLAVPIIANGIRAYLIVMIGYMSNMKLAVGVDHYIYGWALFGFFCLLLFWIGSRLREPPAPKPTEASAAPTEVARIPVGRVVPAALLALIGIGIWPALAARMDAVASTAGPPTLELPSTIGAWRETEDPIAEWRPDYKGATAEASRAYRLNDRTVALYIAYYRNQRQGTELINSVNSIIPLGKDVVWRRGWEQERAVPLPRGTERVWETDASKPGQRILVWHRFWSGGRYTSSQFTAKVQEVQSRMFTGKDDAALVVMLARYPETARPSVAAATLSDFYAAAGPSVNALLDATAKLP